jgi:hypothetical protein
MIAGQFIKFHQREQNYEQGQQWTWVYLTELRRSKHPLSTGHTRHDCPLSQLSVVRLGGSCREQLIVRQNIYIDELRSKCRQIINVTTFCSRKHSYCM